MPILDHDLGHLARKTSLNAFLGGGKYPILDAFTLCPQMTRAQGQQHTAARSTAHNIGTAFRFNSNIPCLAEIRFERRSKYYQR